MCELQQMCKREVWNVCWQNMHAYMGTMACSSEGSGKFQEISNDQLHWDF